MDLGGGIHISDLLENTRVFLQERDGGGRREGGAGGGKEEGEIEEGRREAQEKEGREKGWWRERGEDKDHFCAHTCSVIQPLRRQLSQCFS